LSPGDITHLVTITVTMPFTLEQFDAHYQMLYRLSVATVAGIHENNVVIDSITSIAGSSRRLLAGYVSVVTVVNTNSFQSMYLIQGSLTEAALNRELAAVCVCKSVCVNLCVCVCVNLCVCACV